jgi:hypothetical protein
VSYERIAPGILVLPAYFNPQQLESPDRDGNRVILATFADQYGSPFAVVGRSDSADARFFDASGVPIVSTTVTVNGVLLSNLQEIAGGAGVLNGSGKVFFDVDAGDGNYFGLFSQSLGTFASGQRLPEALAIPVGNTGGPSPTPTLTGSPPTPSVPTPPEPTPTPPENPSGCPGSFTATLAFDIPNAAGVTIRIDYPRTIDIPGFLQDPPVIAATDNLTGVDGLFSPFDQDQDPDDFQNQNWAPFMTIGLVSTAEPIAAGPFARVRFLCENPPAPTDFTCTVTEVSDTAGVVVPGQCSLTLP